MRIAGGGGQEISNFLRCDGLSIGQAGSRCSLRFAISEGSRMCRVRIIVEMTTVGRNRKKKYPVRPFRSCSSTAAVGHGITRLPEERIARRTALKIFSGCCRRKCELAGQQDGADGKHGIYLEKKVVLGTGL
ncbi:unnamed protein product [Nezara viridula]|uniref:Uncharacterized protein n=1 Tax=Nezara viridula TaxID=85310 RepID=A0A9P0HAD6_NEZVI|nr:unnamed protein product [Nezara viridula]